MHPFPGVLALLLAVATAAGAEGEIYRWTDAHGGVHFTRQLSHVPAAQRRSAVELARQPVASRLQTFGDPPEPSFEAIAAPLPSLAPAVLKRRGEIQIPFVQHGTLMLVQVRLNDQIDAPFLIDTGASGVSIPDRVARRLGLRIDADTPRMLVQTASGVVSEPLVELESVQVGPARVEHLEALVNSSMEVGLLGGSFFNNFVYQVDAAEGVITLRPNESVRGGLAEAQWRDRFREARFEIERLATYVAGQDEDSARLAQLHKNLQILKEGLEELQREANLAGVPKNWRE